MLVVLMKRMLSANSIGKFFGIALIGLILTGCGTKTVQLVNENEFNLMGRRITSLLQNRGVLNTEGGYISALLPTSAFPSPVGEILYTGLSPAFRFKLDPKLVPPSFAASKGPADSLEMLKDGFRMTQGADTVTVTLLGGTDWTGNGGKEWFVLCRVNSFVNNTDRDYYLVITDPDSRPMKSELIAVYDCRSRMCTLFVEEKPGKEPAFNPETRVIEVEAGQRPVVPPPAAKGTDAAEDPERAGQPKETKLGQ